MKKILPVLLLISAALFGAVSCSNITAADEQPADSSDSGTATLQITTDLAGGARTIYPDFTADSWYYTLTGTSTAGGTVLRISYTYTNILSSNITCDTGTWTFVLIAKYGSSSRTVLASTIKAQKITAGVNPLKFTMEPFDSTATGSCEVVLYYKNTNDTIQSVKAGLYEIGSNTALSGYEPQTLTPSTSSSGDYKNYKYVTYKKSSIPAGSYILRYTLYSDSTGTTVYTTKSEVIIIYGSGTTNAARSLVLSVTKPLAAADAAAYINALTTAGTYSLTLTGELTSTTLAAIGTALKNKSSSYLFSIDAGACTGLTKIPDNCFYNAADKLDAFIMPSTVTAIGDDAFYKCTKLTGITLPDTLLTIGDYAFNNCTNLSEMTIPDSVTAIGDRAMSFCTSLASVSIGSGVTTIPYGMFNWDSSLTSLTVSDSNTTYCAADNILYSKDKTTLVCCAGGLSGTVSVPSTVTAIGDYAFYNCTNLTGITLPDTLLTIGNYAFSFCTKLSGMTIPDSVTTLGEYSFYYCTGMTSLVLGSGVTKIGASSFYMDSALAVCWYKGADSTAWGTITIGSSNTYLTNAARYYYDSTGTTAGYWWYVNGTPTVIK